MLHQLGPGHVAVHGDRVLHLEGLEPRRQALDHRGVGADGRLEADRAGGPGDRHLLRRGGRQHQRGLVACVRLLVHGGGQHPGSGGRVGARFEGLEQIRGRDEVVEHDAHGNPAVAGPDGLRDPPGGEDAEGDADRQRDGPPKAEPVDGDNRRSETQRGAQVARGQAGARGGEAAEVDQQGEGGEEASEGVHRPTARATPGGHHEHGQGRREERLGQLINPARGEGDLLHRARLRSQVGGPGGDAQGSACERGDPAQEEGSGEDLEEDVGLAPGGRGVRAFHGRGGYQSAPGPTPPEGPERAPLDQIVY